MSVTYHVKTSLATNQKLFVTYMAGYDMLYNYEYGKYINDTLAADSFNITVQYKVPDQNFKGLAGKMKFAILTYDTVGKKFEAWPWGIYYYKVDCTANGVPQYNYGSDGVYGVNSVNW
ncbi:MAG: hypothetical protein ACXVC6_09805 [Bacteroidia bacterium]